MNGAPDLESNPRTLHVRKRPVAVAVVFAAADGTCATLEGSVRFRGGDALLTGVQGERWPVRRQLFEASYDPIPPTQPGQDGQYRKRPAPALALRLQQPAAVPAGADADPLHGKAGDWLLRYADGSFGVVGDAIFRQTYEPDPGETRWPPPP